MRWAGEVTMAATPGRQALAALYAQIEERCAASRSQYPEWPCRQGCSACCRALARAPQVTQAEWALIAAGVSLLPEETRQEIGRRVAALPDGEAPGRHVVCPFLDEARGSCRIYVHRPAACRMYGFYVDRADGLWCQQIEVLCNAGALQGVVLGNHAAVARRLAAELGPVRSVRQWWDGAGEGRSGACTGNGPQERC
ncbi:MAG: YkgJ family cysteine cluster protein [Candidatus Latescibacterota bacterium]